MTAALPLASVSDLEAALGRDLNAARSSSSTSSQQLSETEPARPSPSSSTRTGSRSTAAVVSSPLGPRSSQLTR